MVVERRIECRSIASARATSPFRPGCVVVLVLKDELGEEREVGDETDGQQRPTGGSSLFGVELVRGEKGQSGAGDGAGAGEEAEMQ
jgi:hypothetical protein